MILSKIIYNAVRASVLAAEKYFDMGNFNFDLYYKETFVQLTNGWYPFYYFPCPIKFGAKCHRWKNSGTILYECGKVVPEGNCNTCIFSVVPGCPEVREYRLKVREIRDKYKLRQISRMK